MKRGSLAQEAHSSSINVWNGVLRISLKILCISSEIYRKECLKNDLLAKAIYDRIKKILCYGPIWQTKSILYKKCKNPLYQLPRMVSFLKVLVNYEIKTSKNIQGS